MTRRFEYKCCDCGVTAYSGSATSTRCRPCQRAYGIELGRTAVERRAADRERRERAEAEAAERWAEGWCLADHASWAAKARCRWPWLDDVQGDGPWVVLDGPRARLWATIARPPVDRPGAVVVRLQRGPHRKGAS